MNKNKEIAAYLKPGCHVHLVGIGGVSMRPLGAGAEGNGDGGFRLRYERLRVYG